MTAAMAGGGLSPRTNQCPDVNIVTGSMTLSHTARSLELVVSPVLIKTVEKCLLSSLQGKG